VQKVKNVAQKCRQVSNQKVIEVVADLTIDEDIKRLVKTTVDEFGKIDILVNNAGICRMVSIDNPTYMEKYEQIMNTNTRGVVLLTSLAIPYLEKTKGSIINISSIAGLKPVSFL
jgi:NAD(P)-dependent dehydrogenase (short-subunit alcohol dehydrogenase family)